MASFTGNRSGVQFLEIDFNPEPIILAAAFEKFGMDIRSFRVPLERSVRQVLAPSLAENFEAGGRPAWIPLSDITIKEKARKGFSNAGKILVRTGALARKAGQVNFWTINGPAGEAYINQSALGDVFYGVYHQFGMAGGADEPGFEARPWALIQEEDANEIEEIFFTWIEERATAIGMSIF
jgi:phage gpG-like protein